MIQPRIQKFQTLEQLAKRAADLVVEQALEAIRTRGRFVLVLAGGSTPALLYQALASRELPWDRTLIFWGDERWVPLHDPSSNYAMARTNLLDKVPIPKENLHPMYAPGGLPEAGIRYTAAIEALGLDQPRFDTVLLGMGKDGHTASLFPGTPQAPGLVTPVTGPAGFGPRQRLSMTAKALEDAGNIIFLVAAAGKEAALKIATSEEPAIRMQLPAGSLTPRGQTSWLIA
jgi:6-phosphogluconolactonase